jgi:hypothetical protein
MQQDHSIDFVTMLLAFRADVSIMNNLKKTPLDVFLDKYRHNAPIPAEGDEVVSLLKSSSRAKCDTDGGTLQTEHDIKPPMQKPQDDDEKEVDTFHKAENRFRTDDDYYTYVCRKFYESHTAIQSAVDIPLSIDGNTDFLAALSLQICERRQMQKAGSRMLFLDGGGMKGLLQIDLMCEIEERTGRRIVELFDWIIGTSVGAVMAMALVHGKEV